MYEPRNVNCTGPGDAALILEGLAMAMELLDQAGLTEAEITLRHNVIASVRQASRTTFPATSDYEAACQYAAEEYRAMFLHALEPHRLGGFA